MNRMDGINLAGITLCYAVQAYSDGLIDEKIMDCYRDTFAPEIDRLYTPQPDQSRLLTEEFMTDLIAFRNEVKKALPNSKETGSDYMVIAKAQLAKDKARIEALIKYLKVRWTFTEVINQATDDIHVVFHLPEDWEQELKATSKGE